MCSFGVKFTTISPRISSPVGQGGRKGPSSAVPLREGSVSNSYKGAIWAHGGPDFISLTNYASPSSIIL